MSNFVNYNQILTDLKTAIDAQNMGFAATVLEANDTDFVVVNMPMADIRIKRLIPQALGGRQYYNELVIEIEVAAFHMTSRLNAAIIRGSLTDAVQRFLQVNPRFGAYVDTVIIGPVEFQTDENAAEGAFVASAVAEFHVFFYSDT